MALLNVAIICIIVVFVHTAAFPLNFPGIRSFIPGSAANPNVGTSVDFGYGVSVDQGGKINLAGGLANGYGIDAGIFTQTNGNSATFTNGGGKAAASGGGSAIGNRGASGFGMVDAFVPSVHNGFGMSQAQSLTGGTGFFGRGNGHAGAAVG